jgi:hypothetical protein
MPVRYNHFLTITLHRVCLIVDLVIASFKYQPGPKKRRGRCLKLISARAFILQYTVYKLFHNVNGKVQ